MFYYFAYQVIHKLNSFISHLITTKHSFILVNCVYCAVLKVREVQYYKFSSSTYMNYIVFYILWLIYILQPMSITLPFSINI